MAEEFGDPPAPLDPIESFKLAFDMFSMIFITVVLSFGLIFFGTTYFATGEDGDTTFLALFVISGIILGIVGTIAIIYKLSIDVISIGIHRGNNPHAYQTKSTALTINQKKPASKKYTNVVECENCGQYLNAPMNYKGNIHCPKCHTRFKINHQKTDQESDSDSF